MVGAALSAVDDAIAENGSPSFVSSVFGSENILPSLAFWREQNVFPAKTQTHMKSDWSVLAPQEGPSKNKIICPIHTSTSQVEPEE